MGIFITEVAKPAKIRSSTSLKGGQLSGKISPGRQIEYSGKKCFRGRSNIWGKTMWNSRPRLFWSRSDRLLPILSTMEPGNLGAGFKPAPTTGQNILRSE
jgi:hypothetical protein